MLIINRYSVREDIVDDYDNIANIIGELARLLLAKSPYTRGLTERFLSRASPLSDWILNAAKT